MAGPNRLGTSRGRGLAVLAGLVLFAGAAAATWLLRGVWEGRGLQDQDGAFFLMAVVSAALGLGCLVGLRRFVVWARGWCSILAVGIPVGFVLAMSGCERAKNTVDPDRPATALAFAGWHAVALVLVLLAIRAETAPASAEAPPPVA